MCFNNMLAVTVESLSVINQSKNVLQVVFIGKDMFV